MNALPKLQPINVRPLQKPIYERWDLVRLNDEAAWIAANREAIRSWYNDLAVYALPDEMPDPFEEFARSQFAIERDFYEQLRDDAKHDHLDEVRDDDE